MSNIWIVDYANDQVFQYDNATSRDSGSQAADAFFDLADGNHNPHGIADPRPFNSEQQTVVVDSVTAGAFSFDVPEIVRSYDCATLETDSVLAEFDRDPKITPWELLTAERLAFQQSISNADHDGLFDSALSDLSEEDPVANDLLEDLLLEFQSDE